MLKSFPINTSISFNSSNGKEEKMNNLSSCAQPKRRKYLFGAALNVSECSGTISTVSRYCNSTVL